MGRLLHLQYRYPAATARSLYCRELILVLSHQGLTYWILVGDLSAWSVDFRRPDDGIGLFG